MYGTALHYVMKYVVSINNIINHVHNMRSLKVCYRAVGDNPTGNMLEDLIESKFDRVAPDGVRAKLIAAFSESDRFDVPCLLTNPLMSLTYALICSSLDPDK